MTITAEEVVQKVISLKRMSDLDAKLFSEEDGYAAILANHFKKSGHELKATQLRKVFHSLKVSVR